MTIFDLVRSIPRDVSPVQIAQGKRSLVKSVFRPLKAASPDWTPLTKHINRIRRFAFRASISLDADILFSISKYFSSMANCRNTPLFPNLCSLTTDFYINVADDSWETWDCIPALSASGTLTELHLRLSSHIEVDRALYPLKPCLPYVFRTNPSLSQLSCSNLRGVTHGPLLDSEMIPLSQLQEVYLWNCMATFPFITALALSTQLSILAVELPMFGGPAGLSMEPSSSFENLTVLRLIAKEDKPFADWMTFLQSIKSTKLTELELRCGRGWQDPETARAFFETLSRFHRLSKFSLCPDIALPHSQATIHEGAFDFMEIVGPVLSLEDMVVFDIQGHFRLDIDAKHLSDIASSWTRLKTLILLPCITPVETSPSPRKPPLQALETFARYAPQLVDLRIVMESLNALEPMYVKALKEEMFDGRLEYLVVSLPDMWQLPSSSIVADFLHILYPELTHAHFHDRVNNLAVMIPHQMHDV
ncbi:hypothetical protein BDY19DRAFT_990491 [Irpex rosettiformis]|uniref:Uncharacterized protein n=1 Tax=Irpex rosettiformis TaxID=378272 RepID=A0ACB8UEW8_9APHY|nr:hypothetical protein BDY19DRAFT_990491 [Irpex rosettiformis]